MALQQEHRASCRHVSLVPIFTLHDAVYEKQQGSARHGKENHHWETENAGVIRGTVGDVANVGLP